MKKHYMISSGKTLGVAPLCMSKLPTLLVRVARSTFCQVAKSIPEKSQILVQGAEKRVNHFPDLSAVKLQSHMNPQQFIKWRYSLITTVAQQQKQERDERS